MKKIIKFSLICLSSFVLATILISIFAHGNNFDASHKKRRGCIGQCENVGNQCKLTAHNDKTDINDGTLSKKSKLNAWNDKNYFEGTHAEIIEQLKQCNSECLYGLKLLSCPKCGSYRIVGNVPRDRGVIKAFHCLDCNLYWKISHYLK